jgi:hypothetical protein
LVAVELPGERTTTSRTLLQPDGSRRTEVFTSPVHFRDADGTGSGSTTRWWVRTVRGTLRRTGRTSIGC